MSMLEGFATQLATLRAELDDTRTRLAALESLAYTPKTTAAPSTTAAPATTTKPAVSTSTSPTGKSGK